MRDRKGLGTVHGLGELEARVMNVLWGASGPLSVRDVLTAISSDRPLAYTTILTVLDNLHRKGRVERSRAGKAFRYWPSQAREDAAADALRAVLRSTSDPEGVLLHFARSLDQRQSDVLRQALHERPAP